MWPRSKELQALAVFVVFVLCYRVLGIEPLVGQDSDGKIATLLRLIGESGWFHADEYGFIVRVNDYWIGLVKTEPAMLNSPFLLWGGMFILAFSIYQLLFEWEARAESAPIEDEPGEAYVPSKPLKTYLNPHDPLWGLLSSSKATTVIVGDQQRTSVDVLVGLHVGGRSFGSSSWNLIASDDQTFTLASADCYITLHGIDGQWHGWWNAGDGRWMRPIFSGS